MPAAAYHYGLLSGTDLLWYKPSFDIALAEYSPGQALMYSLVEWCLTNERGCLDFTRGDEAFKMRYANASTSNASFTCYASALAKNRHRAVDLARGAAGRALHALGLR